MIPKTFVEKQTSESGCLGILVVFFYFFVFVRVYLFGEIKRFARVRRVPRIADGKIMDCRIGVESETSEPANVGRRARHTSYSESCVPANRPDSVHVRVQLTDGDEWSTPVALWDTVLRVKWRVAMLALSDVAATASRIRCVGPDGRSEASDCARLERFGGRGGTVRLAVSVERRSGGVPPAPRTDSVGYADAATGTVYRNAAAQCDPENPRPVCRQRINAVAVQTVPTSDAAVARVAVDFAVQTAFAFRSLNAVAVKSTCHTVCAADIYGAIR